uniref:NADH dehydrogenase subunit 6 n=1 Tax=Schizopera knabeni TaxID=1432316 RepID=W8DNC8_9MAXI|nr:NADH dehydrogenase subunit 6 [Schizopera knabeni]
MSSFFLLATMVLGFMIFSSLSPLVVSFLLIVLSMFIGLLCWTLVSKWLAISLFFIFVGGMMVVFLYVSSISMNLKFLLKPLSSFSIPLIVCVTVLNFTDLSCSLFPSAHFFELCNMGLLFYLVVYLLATLFVSSKLSECFKGSLIQKF